MIALPRRFSPRSRMVPGASADYRVLERLTVKDALHPRCRRALDELHGRFTKLDRAGYHQRTRRRRPQDALRTHDGLYEVPGDAARSGNASRRSSAMNDGQRPPPPVCPCLLRRHFGLQQDLGRSSATLACRLPPPPKTALRCPVLVRPTTATSATSSRHQAWPWTLPRSKPSTRVAASPARRWFSVSGHLPEVRPQLWRHRRRPGLGDGFPRTTTPRFHHALRATSAPVLALPDFTSFSPGA